jgi:hypothetical protein
MPGVVEILAVMSLEKPRSLPGKPKTVVLDAGIFWKPPMLPILASLRYYNAGDENFQQCGSLFYVLARVCHLLMLFVLPITVCVFSLGSKNEENDRRYKR